MSFLKNGFSLPPSVLMRIFILFYLHRRLGQGKKRSDTSRCARCLCVALTRGSKLQYFGHSMRQLSENFNFFGSLWLPLISDGWRKVRKHFEVHSWNVGHSRNKGWGGEGEVKMAYGLVPPFTCWKSWLFHWVWGPLPCASCALSTAFPTGSILLILASCVQCSSRWWIIIYNKDYSFF